MFHIIKQAILSFIFKSPAGLLPHEDDERDFVYGWFFGSSAYTPKYNKVDIQTLSIKNQIPLNTCTWNAAIVQKEIDEGKQLSVKFLVALAKKRNLLWGNGFSYLRNTQKLLVDAGACEEQLCPDVKSSWDTYSSTAALSYNNMVNASTHKSARFFLVSTKDETLKALDEGRVIQTGLVWRTAYNNVKAPYILQLGAGASVGGHSVLIVGYDLVRGVLKFQNSFGKDWGDNGCFYIRIKDWFAMGDVGYVTVDISNADLAAMYEGKDVKSADGPAIYRIESGKKRVFPNQDVFFKHGGKFGPNKTWQFISGSLLKSIPDGQPML